MNMYATVARLAWGQYARLYVERPLLESRPSGTFSRENIDIVHLTRGKAYCVIKQIFD